MAARPSRARTQKLQTARKAYVRLAYPLFFIQTVNFLKGHLCMIYQHFPFIWFARERPEKTWMFIWTRKERKIEMKVMILTWKSKEKVHCSSKLDQIYLYFTAIQEKTGVSYLRRGSYKGCLRDFPITPLKTFWVVKLHWMVAPGWGHDPAADSRRPHQEG